MTTKQRPRFLHTTFLLLLLAPLHTQASGSVEFFSDVAPLLEKRPDLQLALEEIDFNEPGEATRIGRHISPILAGRRVGPYLFRALLKGNGGSVQVRFASYVRFLDANGQVLAEMLGGELRGDEQLEKAVSLEEEIVAIAVTPI